MTDYVNEVFVSGQPWKKCFVIQTFFEKVSYLAIVSQVYYGDQSYWAHLGLIKAKRLSRFFCKVEFQVSSYVAYIPSKNDPFFTDGVTLLRFFQKWFFH